MASRKKSGAKSGSVMSLVSKNCGDMRTKVGIALAGLFVLNAILAWIVPDIHATLWNWMLLGAVTINAVETVKLSSVIAGIITWFLLGYIAAAIASKGCCCGKCE